MAAIMNAIERVTVETGAAVAFGSHYSKGNQALKESIDRISGSGVFARDPDSIVTMTRHEEDDAFAVELTLRNLPPQDSFAVRRRHPLMVIDNQLDPAKLKQAVGRKSIYSPEDALKCLTQGMTTTAWEDACKKESIPRTVFYRLRKELEQKGKIIKSEINETWLWNS